jgi:hypothetical protein
MTRIRKFLRLPLSDQGLLLQSFTLLASITLGLRVLPFQLVAATLGSLASRSSVRRTGQVPAERVAWAVRIASHYLPAADCLSRALATRTLLKRRGYTAKIYIGLSRAAKGQLEAQAWVESEGAIVMGGLPDLARYAASPSLENEAG